jgi:hypothetical protein
VRWVEIDGDVRWERIDRSVFCGAPGATTAGGAGIDPRLSLPAIKNLFRQAGISKDFFCSFSFSERKGDENKEKVVTKPLQLIVKGEQAGTKL